MKQTIELHKRWKADPSKGEVFTPSELVREMLDKIPTNVWENPESKFLDPCMGKGTFIIEIVKRLVNIYGYSKEDAISRVYGYDTCVKYVNYLKRGGMLNVFHKDFLNEVNDMKFDVVIGNPPYQDFSHKAKKSSLWKKFLEKGNEIKSSYLFFVIPASFASPTKLFDSFKKNIVNIDFTPKKYFPGVGSSFCYVLISDKKQVTTKITTNDGDFFLNMDNFDCLPLEINETILKECDEVFKGEKKWNLTCEYHTQNFSDFSDDGEYEVIHSTKIKRTNTNHQNNGKIRVHISVTNNTIFSVSVNQGLTQNHVWTEFSNMEDAIRYKDYLNSEKVQRVLNLFRYSNMNYKKVISRL
jgi:hypothetical protein